MRPLPCYTVCCCPVPSVVRERTHQYLIQQTVNCARIVVSILELFILRLPYVFPNTIDTALKRRRPPEFMRDRSLKVNVNYLRLCHV